MQQMHTHKAVTGHVEAKKLLSPQRQSEYSTQMTWRGQEGEDETWLRSLIIESLGLTSMGILVISGVGNLLELSANLKCV